MKRVCKVDLCCCVFQGQDGSPGQPGMEGRTGKPGMPVSRSLQLTKDSVAKQGLFIFDFNFKCRVHQVKKVT